MFTGIGGFELGIQQAYDTQQPNEATDKTDFITRRIGAITTRQNSIHTFGNNAPLCVGFAENDKYCAELLKKKWPGVKNYGDATKINEKTLPDFDMLVGGFPCQAFSLAGHRKGFDDTRGTLFFDVAKILKHKQPSLVVLENVKGLLSHDKGKTFAKILQTFNELGYEYQFGVVNSRFNGVPQNRERVFIIANLRESTRPKVFPLCNCNTKNNETYQQSNATRTITTAHAHSSSTNMSYIKTDKIRRLTPIECERLQGFPDNWTQDFSDTQRYKMLGNAITVNVVKRIMSEIYGRT